MSLSAPTQLTLGFAENGTKNAIPNASQIGITPGAASFNDGFPPATRQPVAAGGVPPFGEDMNGILYQLSKDIQWEQAGGRYVYNGAYATAIGGYPLSAVVQSSDGLGSWLNTSANNTADPEAAAVPNNWQPVGFRGYTTKALTNANVTLTNLESAKETIVLTGALTGNVVLTVQPFLKGFQFVNQTTGAFTLQVKTPTGAAITLGSGTTTLRCDGTTLNQDVNPLVAGRLLGVQVFAANSTYTRNPLATFAIGDLVGGGGGTGGAPATGSGQFSGSPGSSSGSYIRALWTAAQLGASQSVTVGAGGTLGGAGSSTGGNGGTTSLGGLASAPGGIGSSSYGPTGATFAVSPPAALAGNPTLSVGTLLFSGRGNQGGMAVGGTSGGVVAGTAGASPIAGGSYGTGATGTAVGSSAGAAAGFQGTGGVVIMYEYA